MKTTNNSSPEPIPVSNDLSSINTPVESPENELLSPFDRVRRLPTTLKALGVGLMAVGVSAAVVLSRRDARFEASHAFNQEHAIRGSNTAAAVAAATVLISHVRNKT